MDFLEALILSVIEGITEFLPISSTGHLILASMLLNISQTDFVKSFEIIIQLGAIAAVASLYWKDLFLKKETFFKVAVAFLPTGILGLIFYKIIKSYLLGNLTVTLLSLLIGGLAIIWLEFYLKKRQSFGSKIADLSYSKAVGIGFFQSISMIPGVSRAAATIFGSMILGLSREEAVKFSFLLAIPTMLAATGYDLLKSVSIFTNQDWGILSVGFVGSLLVALVVVKWFINFVRSNNLIPFGIYRIILAAVYFYLVLGLLSTKGLAL